MNNVREQVSFQVPPSLRRISAFQNSRLALLHHNLDKRRAQGILVGEIPELAAEEKYRLPALSGDVLQFNPWILECGDVYNATLMCINNFNLPPLDTHQSKKVFDRAKVETKSPDIYQIMLGEAESLFQSKAPNKGAYFLVYSLYLLADGMGINFNELHKKTVRKNSRNYPTVGLSGKHYRTKRALNEKELTERYDYAVPTYKLLRKNSGSNPEGMAPDVWLPWLNEIGDFKNPQRNWQIINQGLQAQRLAQ